MLTRIACALLLVSATAIPALAAPPKVTWVSPYPVLTTLPPNNTPTIDCRSTATVGAGNTMVYKFRKVGTQAWSDAPSGLNNGVYGAYIQPGTGSWEVKPVIVDAQGNVVASDTVMVVNVP